MRNIHFSFPDAWGFAVLPGHSRQTRFLARPELLTRL